MPVIGCLEIFQNGRSPQPITGIIYSPGPHELKIDSAVEDTLGFIPLVFSLERANEERRARAQHSSISAFGRKKGRRAGKTKPLE